LDFLEEGCVESILECIRYLQQRNSKTIFLCLSYGEKSGGKYSYTQSMEFFANFLKRRFESVIFEKSILIENFEEKMETEAYPEGCLVVLENAYFYGEETGFLEKGEEKSHCKLMLEDRLEYLRLISEYGNVFVLEDKHCIYEKRLGSLENGKSDCRVLGLRMG
jgi:3-phosphoglycerate kinase